MKIGNRIIITDGKLSMRDGSSLKKYLKKWQKENNTDNGDSVNVVETSSLVLLEHLSSAG